jgi:hypothetical protein
MTIATYRGVRYTVGAPGGEDPSRQSAIHQDAQQEPVSELAVIKEQVIKQDKLKKFAYLRWLFAQQGKD